MPQLRVALLLLALLLASAAAESVSAGPGAQPGAFCLPSPLRSAASFSLSLPSGTLRAAVGCWLRGRALGALFYRRVLVVGWRHAARCGAWARFPASPGCQTLLASNRRGKRVPD